MRYYLEEETNEKIFASENPSQGMETPPTSKTLADQEPLGKKGQGL